jgi:hypothetical protein
VSDTIQGNDDLTKQIQEKQEEELSYIKEASNASDERTKYLAKKNKYIIAFDDGSKRTLTRKPLSNKKNREIDDLRTAFANIRYIDPEKPVKVGDKEFTSVGAIVYEAFLKTAEYCLGLTAEEYDNAIAEDDDDLIEQDIWGTRSVLLACLVKAVHGQAYFHKPSKTS